jgi:hypothetical protein
LIPLTACERENNEIGGKFCGWFDVISRMTLFLKALALVKIDFQLNFIKTFLADGIFAFSLMFEAELMVKFAHGLWHFYVCTHSYFHQTHNYK